MGSWKDYILQSRTYVCVCVCLHACVLSCSVVSDSFMKTPQTIACQVPLSRGFFREEYCSQLPFPSPGDLPDPGVTPASLHCRQTLYQLSHQGSLPRILGEGYTWLSLIKQRVASGHGWTVDPIVNTVTALEVKFEKQSSRNEVASMESEG